MTPRRWLGLIRGIRGERGTTLTEVLVTMVVMTIAATIFLAVLASIQTGVSREDARSQNNDQIRLAFQSLDREVRSGNVLYDPAAESSPTVAYYGVRIYTQSNAGTRGALKCVQWRIDDSNQLITRNWVSGNPSGATSWRVVAENIVNRVVSPAVPAFALDPNSSGRTLDVTLLVNKRQGSADTKAVRAVTSVTLRNPTTSDPCTPVPAG